MVSFCAKGVCLLQPCHYLHLVSFSAAIDFYIHLFFFGPIWSSNHQVFCQALAQALFPYGKAKQGMRGKHMVWKIIVENNRANTCHMSGVQTP